MSLSTDRFSDLSKLSPAGRCLIQAKNRIEDGWSSKVRDKIKPAAHLTHPILLDTIPSYLENLAEALSPALPRITASDSSTTAQEHGGERARLTNYELDHVVIEYQLLRETVFEVLDSEVPLSTAERYTINVSIDMAIREAVAGFAIIQANIREQFIAMLTHDLRHPLSVISMASEFIPDDVVIEDENIGIRKTISENIRKAESLIKDLLDATLVKRGGKLSLTFSPCDILKLVESCVHQYALNSHATIRYNGQSIMGYWSSRELVRALDNLISNAIKYGNASEPIVIDFREENERLFLSVHNEGNPIPVEEQVSIFQSFRRARAAREGASKGWGVGLALVRAIAEGHGGSITVDSAVGKGTTFIIDIPKDARPFQNTSAPGE